MRKPRPRTRSRSDARGAAHLGPKAKARAKPKPTPKAKPKKSPAVGGAAAPPLKAPKTGKAKAVQHDEHGPLGWLLPMLGLAYAPLVSRAAPAAVAAAGAPMAAAAVGLPAAVSAAAAVMEPTAWRDVLLEYKQRKAARFAPTRAAVPVGVPRPAAPMIPGARNWQPLGPTVVLNGQTTGDEPVAGRVSRLAVAPDAAAIYAASANGGVFRSTNGGTSWQSLMDRFDLNPTDFASTSLVWGAIALDPQDPNRVYVGTGEGDTHEMFRKHLAMVHALPAYRGVGAIRSDDGGQSWIPEPSEPDLGGEAFFDMVVDPRDRENVMAGTTVGLYRRVRKPGGQFRWERVRPGVHASVAATAAAGARRFFAAEWGQGAGASAVFHSDDGGATWTATGTGFPTDDVGRIALGVQPDKPDLLYAFVATRRAGLVHGLYRLDGVGSAWKKIGNVPDVLPRDPNSGTSQGDYDLAIAVDPVDPEFVYLGGSYADIDPFPASVWRCEIAAAGGALRVKKSASIGTHAHSDVHALVHTPGVSNELWCTCDGGVFLNRNPRGNGEFDSQNNGLACLCCNFIAQHPTDPSILFTGLQDNGTARASGGSIWSHVWGGDGGYCLINWANPDLVLVFANGTVVRSTTGGKSKASWETQTDFNWPTMTQPIVGLPFNAATPVDANVVAVGAGPAVFVSNDFGASWPTRIAVPGMGNDEAVFALAFANPRRLFIGTTRGRVFRAERAGSAWTVSRLDDAAAGPIGLNGIITDVAVDWADANRRSLYVSFGGKGDRRRVWWFDGASWHERSGAAGGNGLLDVEHNALAVDRAAPNNIYVGADIGVWHSADGGLNWQPLENGLPDAPVFDLQIHPTQRLLRAATHGRGIFEYTLD